MPNTVDLADSEKLSNSIISIITDATKRFEEETGLSLVRLRLEGKTNDADNVTVRVKSEAEQYRVKIDRNTPKKIASKCISKAAANNR